MHENPGGGEPRPPLPPAAGTHGTTNQNIHRLNITNIEIHQTRIHKD